MQDIHSTGRWGRQSSAEHAAGVQYVGINPPLPRALWAPPKQPADPSATTLKDWEDSEPLGASVKHNRLLRWTVIYLILSASPPACVAFNSLSYGRHLPRYRVSEISRCQHRVTTRQLIGPEVLL